MRFTNKTVFITGAAGGIGRQTGLSFAKEGANVAVSDLDFDMASRVAKEIKSAGGNAEPFKLDVTNQNETIENIDRSSRCCGAVSRCCCHSTCRWSCQDQAENSDTLLARNSVWPAGW